MTSAISRRWSPASTQRCGRAEKAPTVPWSSGTPSSSGVQAHLLPQSHPLLGGPGEAAGHFFLVLGQQVHRQRRRTR